MPTEVRNYTVGYTHTLTPTLVNDLRVGRNFFKSDALNAFAVAGLNTAGSDLGISGFTGDVQYNNPGIPDFNITGFNGLGNWRNQLVSERQHSPDFRTDQLGAGVHITSWPASNFDGSPPDAPL